MSTHKLVTMFKYPDKTIPQEAFEKVLEEHKSMAGFATALQLKGDDGEPTQVLETFFNMTGPSVKEILDQQSSYVEDGCYFCFGDFPKGTTEASGQPYIILRADDTDENSDPILIAMIDGEFPAHEKDGEDGSLVVADILRGTFARFMKTAENVTEMAEAILTDDKIPRLIKGLQGSRCCITILAEDGTTGNLGENPKYVEFDWGWMSQSCGYGEKTIAEKAKGAVASAVRTFGGGRRTATAENSLQPASSEQTAAHQTSAKGGGGDDAAYIMVSAPASDHKDQKRDFYKALNNGIVPQKYKDSPQIKILRSKWDKYCKDKGIKPIADVEPVVSSNTGTTTEIIPKAPPTELVKLKDFQKRATVVKIQNEGRSMIDPKRIEETEKKYATFIELTGHKSILDVVTYTNEDFMSLIKDTPTVAMILMGNMAGEIIRRTPADELNPPKKEETVEKATGTTGRPSGVRTFGAKK